MDQDLGFIMPIYTIWSLCLAIKWKHWPITKVFQGIICNWPFNKNWKTSQCFESLGAIRPIPKAGDCTLNLYQKKWVYMPILTLILDAWPWNCGVHVDSSLTREYIPKNGLVKQELNTIRITHQMLNWTL